MTEEQFNNKLKELIDQYVGNRNDVKVLVAIIHEVEDDIIYGFGCRGCIAEALIEWMQAENIMHMDDDKPVHNITKH